MGLEVDEGPLPVDRIGGADEAFLTSSLRGMLPMTRLLGRALPAPGPMTRELWAETFSWLEFPRNDKMTTVAHVTAWLEQFAPARLAEPWDNVGLLWGDPGAPVERVMTCLTVTPASAAEAIRERAGLIVSHHPVLFREVKRIRADRQKPVISGNWPARGSRSPAHTPRLTTRTMESTTSFAAVLAWWILPPLRPFSHPAGGWTPGPSSFKVVVFTPAAERDAVSSAAFAAGAGQIGAYDECSFAIPGEGTFFGNRRGKSDRRRAWSQDDRPRATAGVRLPHGQAGRCSRGGPRQPLVRRARY